MFKINLLSVVPNKLLHYLCLQLKEVVPDFLEDKYELQYHDVLFHITLFVHFRCLFGEFDLTRNLIYRNKEERVLLFVDLYLQAQIEILMH